MGKKGIFIILTIITFVMFVYCCDIPIIHPNFWFLVNHKDDGDLLYNIGVSFIAAYIFYVFQICIPDHFELQKQIPLRAAVQREVQFFVARIVYLWVEYYKYAIKNNMLIGADDKNTKRIFTETNMLEILKCIKISQSCDVDVVNVKNDTWKEYTQKQLSLIIERGERIINYRMSVLSPDIYYAIVYLVHESVTIFALNGILGTPRLLENFGKNPTLY